MLSFELLLMLGVLGFYLYDSGMLLCVNEIVLLNARRRWSFACPQSSWQVLGRNPYIPNPLTPGRALFRVHWSETDRRGAHGDESLGEFLRSLAPVRALVTSLSVILLVALPLVLVFYGSGPQLLMLFVAAYVNVVLILIQVYRARDVLNVSRGRFWTLSFEVLACAPFALNTLRKLSLHRALAAEPLGFARERLDRGSFVRLVAAVCRRIDAQLELMDADSPRYAALQAYKQRVAGMAL